MKRKCPKCGKFMKKNHMPGPEGIIWYECSSCGYNNCPEKTKRSFIDEADSRRSNERAWTRMNLEAQDQQR